jgi:hypothetical protein
MAPINDRILEKVAVFKQAYGVELRVWGTKTGFYLEKYIIDNLSSCVNAVVTLDLSSESNLYYVAAIVDCDRGGRCFPSIYALDYGMKMGVYVPRDGFERD